MLEQLGFTYSTFRPFTKHRERIKKFKGTGNLKHLYRNELDKAGFAHDAAYSNSKDLAKRRITYEIARNHGYDKYQRALAIMVYKFFDKKPGSGISINEQLAEELHKPVIKKFKKRKVYGRFKYNISAADLTEMVSLSAKNKNDKYLLCVIDFLLNMHVLNRRKIKNSALTEKIESNPKAPKFKVNDRVRSTKYKNIFSKG